MRKSKRFIKKFSKSFFCIVVAFVALINACFFMPMQVQASSQSLTSFLDLFYYRSTLGFLMQPDTDFNLISQTAPVVSSNNTPVIVDGSTSENTSRFEFSVQTSLFTNSLQSLQSSYFEDGYAYINGSITLANDFYFSPSGTQGSRLYLESVELVTPSGVSVPFVYESTVVDRGSSNYGLSVQCFLTFTNVQISNLSTYLNLCSLTYNFLGYTAQSTNYCNFTIVPVEFSAGGNVFSGPAPGSSVDIIEGYDDSAGNQVSSDFESGVNDYDQAEDNLFNTSTGALQGFEFFDFGSFSAVTSGLSFCSSLLTSIYENFGGLSGIGIVISVLFSVLFMAIVIGLFRYYK